MYIFRETENIILEKETVITSQLDIFTVSETWLDSTATDVEVEFSIDLGLSQIKRENKPGGGVCIFAKRDFKIERLSNLSYITESGLHMLWLKKV